MAKITIGRMIAWAMTAEETTGTDFIDILKNGRLCGARALRYAEREVVNLERKPGSNSLLQSALVDQRRHRDIVKRQP
jgi:hypothetical protein